MKREYNGTGWLLVLSGLTDVVDVGTARRFHMVSDFRKILDPIVDKLTQAVMIFCLMTRLPHMIIPLLLMLAK